MASPTLLMIGQPERRRLEALRAFAEHRKHWRDLAKDRRPPGDDKRFRCTLPVPNTPDRHWRIVYSIDIDPELGPLKHLSVSIAGVQDRLPNAAAMIMIGTVLSIQPPYLHLGPTPGDAGIPAIHLVAAFGEPS